MSTKATQIEETKSLPLQAERAPTYKFIGLSIVFLGVILLNYFMFAGDKKETLSKNDHETYEGLTMSPISKASEVNSLVETAVPHGGVLEKDMQETLAKAKAQDFIERLQASQGAADTGVDANISRSNEVHDHALVKGHLSDPNTAFLVQQGNSKAEHVYATHYGSLPFMLGQGKFIFATLSVAINSDLPGQVSAIVSQDVYGDQGRKVLIPRGSILIGEYKSGLVNNQSRLFVVWTRVREPNGIDAMLGSEGTDYIGRAGLTGNVDYHFFARFGSASLVALLGAGASTVGVNPRDDFNSLASYRQDITQALSTQASSMLSQSLSIPPTIHVPQGEKIVVYVNRDIDFSRVYR